MNNRCMIFGVGLICGMAFSAGMFEGALAFDRSRDMAFRGDDGSASLASVNKTSESAPLSARRAEPSVPPADPNSARKGTSGSETQNDNRTMMFTMTPPSGNGEMATVRSLWGRLVVAPQPDGPLELRADNFTLTLDSERYQVIPAADGGKIIIDANRDLPPLVKSLIQSNDPGIRIVSESPGAGKRFYTPLLQAGGFYSVEPDFSLEFGDDPRLTVQADYRIERTAESFLRNEAVLLYTGDGRNALPESLQGFLGNAGFQIVEPDLPNHGPPPKRDRFVRVAPGEQFQAADALLEALGLDTKVNKAVEFTGWAQQGISLMVRVDREFDFQGKRFALSIFDGSPVTYTLIRLLETQGMTVVVLGKDDAFHEVTGKLLSALKLTGTYERHQLWPLRETPYTVQMSGFTLQDPRTGGTIFLTDRSVDPLLLDLIDRNGYSVAGGQQ